MLRSLWAALKATRCPHTGRASVVGPWTNDPRHLKVRTITVTCPGCGKTLRSSTQTIADLNRLVAVVRAAGDVVRRS